MQPRDGPSWVQNVPQLTSYKNLVLQRPAQSQIQEDSLAIGVNANVRRLCTVQVRGNYCAMLLGAYFDVHVKDLDCVEVVDCVQETSSHYGKEGPTACSYTVTKHVSERY